MRTDYIIIALLAVLVLQNTILYKQVGGFFLYSLPGRIRKLFRKVFYK